MNFKHYFEESSRLTTVYHVSPRSDIFTLRSIGSKKGLRAYIGKKQSGIYVAPKFRDALAWASTYVSHKKEDSQKPNERLKEKGGGIHGEKGPRKYSYLTIYEIQVPTEVLKKSEFNTFWEPEYFISKEFIDTMKIVKSTTYSRLKIEEMYNKILLKRYEFVPQGVNSIKSISKTNLAAKYYLELTEYYNKLRLSKKIDYNETIKEEIDKLKEYFGYYDNNIYRLKDKLGVKEMIEVEEIYKKVKNMMN